MVRSIRTLADAEAALRELDNQLNVLKHAAQPAGATIVSTPTIILPNSLVQLGKVITQNPAKAQIGGVGDSGKNYPLLFGNLAVNAFVTLSGNTTLITPSTGYYLTGVTLSVDPNSTKSGGAGSILASITDSSSGTIWAVVFYLGGTAPTGAAGLVFNTPPGFFWNNKVSGSLLRINLSSAFASGGLYVSYNYGLTSIVN